MKTGVNRTAMYGRLAIRVTSLHTKYLVHAAANQL